MLKFEWREDFRDSSREDHETYEEGEGEAEAEGEERARQRIVQRPSTTYEFVYDGDEQANRATTTVSIHAFRSHI